MIDQFALHARGKRAREGSPGGAARPARTAAWEPGTGPVQNHTEGHPAAVCNHRMVAAA